MRKIVFAFLLMALPVLLHAQKAKFTKVKPTENITLRLPEDFSPLTEQEMQDRYASSRRPIVFYGSYDRNAELSINTSSSSWASFDLPLAKDFYKASLSALYTDIDWMRDEMVEVDGRQYAVFEFIGTVADPEEEQVVRRQKPISKYIMVAYTIVNHKAVVISFTAPSLLAQQWQPTAQEILEGIQLKKTL